MTCFILVLLRSETPSGMCAKLHTVAASNNRDHPTRSLSSSPLASTINCSPGSQALLEDTHQDHSIGMTLLLLVRATYIYICSSRTSRWWWIIQSTQHHRRGCNSIVAYSQMHATLMGCEWMFPTCQKLQRQMLSRECSWKQWFKIWNVFALALND